MSESNQQTTTQADDQRGVRLREGIAQFARRMEVRAALNERRGELSRPTRDECLQATVKCLGQIAWEFHRLGNKTRSLPQTWPLPTVISQRAKEEARTHAADLANWLCLLCGYGLEQTAESCDGAAEPTPSNDPCAPLAVNERVWLGRSKTRMCTVAISFPDGQKATFGALGGSVAKILNLWVQTHVQDALRKEPEEKRRSAEDAARSIRTMARFPDSQVDAGGQVQRMVEDVEYCDRVIQLAGPLVSTLLDRAAFAYAAATLYDHHGI